MVCHHCGTYTIAGHLAQFARDTVLFMFVLPLTGSLVFAADDLGYWDATWLEDLIKELTVWLER